MVTKQGFRAIIEFLGQMGAGFHVQMVDLHLWNLGEKAIVIPCHESNYM